jgi:hypothetical protein
MSGRIHRAIVRALSRGTRRGWHPAIPRSAQHAGRATAPPPAMARVCDLTNRPTGPGWSPCPARPRPTAFASPARPRAGTMPSGAGCARRSMARPGRDTRAGSEWGRTASSPSPPILHPSTEGEDKFIFGAMPAAGWADLRGDRIALRQLPILSSRKICRIHPGSGCGLDRNQSSFDFAQDESIRHRPPYSAHAERSRSISAGGSARLSRRRETLPRRHALHSLQCAPI